MIKTWEFLNSLTNEKFSKQLIKFANIARPKKKPVSKNSIIPHFSQIYLPAKQTLATTVQTKGALKFNSKKNTTRADVF